MTLLTSLRGERKSKNSEQQEALLLAGEASLVPTKKSGRKHGAV